MSRSAPWFPSRYRRTPSLWLGLIASFLIPGVAVAQQSVREREGRMMAHNDPNVIASHQLRAHPDLPTAYAMVEALHSNWLRERRADPPSGSDGRSRRLADGARAPAGENAGVQVYLDGHRLGGVELMRSIPTVIVHSIRHVNAIDAQARYGIGHSHGVIVVSTISGRP